MITSRRLTPRTWAAAPLALGLLALLLASLAAAALTFPPLTGRVVDAANIIPPDTRDALDQKLADLEAKGGVQLVVATVPSLQGQDIAPFANELFRTWKLGQSKVNNGVLLLVAPNEKRVRIEVGYGLEGTITDAMSETIIANAMAPRFKTGDFAGGITRGVDDVITLLTTDPSEWQQRPAIRLDSDGFDPVTWLLFAGLFALITLLIVSPGFRYVFLNVLLNVLANPANSGTWGGGYGGFPEPSGGGFRGGGGSSGGGGASGGW
jgi:uncharacterized protein